MRPNRLATNPTGFRASLVDAQRETRAEVVGRLLDAIDHAISAGEFAGIEVGPDEAVNSNIVADLMVSLQNARDMAERIRWWTR